MKALFTIKNILTRISLLSLALIQISNYGFSQTTHNVAVTSNVFTPANLTINVGDKVIWTNTQGNHNVNATQSTFPSNPESFGNNVAADWTFEHVFNNAGSYDYQCDPHVNFGMVGTVEVVDMTTNILTINFSAMTPHVGQSLSLLVKDKDTGDELMRKYMTVAESFSIMVEGIEAGHSYEVDFFSDHNGNGSYDAPPVDHAWRMDLDNVSGDEMLSFSHNTEFKDIEWDHMAFVNFSGMTPHVGQELYIALYDETMGMEVDRESEIVAESFSVALGKLMPGNSYRIDFFSDHNDNNLYDAPPTDHSWRLEIQEAAGDEMLNFEHNTNFVDLDWMYKLTTRFSEMTPHIGQKLNFYLKDLQSGQNVDTVMLSEITDVDFDLESFKIIPGNAYQLNFYADHNGNGNYDAPPVDHAWRIEVPSIEGDTKVEFVHNTVFTDIFTATGLAQSSESNSMSLYPNPVRDYLYISSNEADSKPEFIRIYSVTGALVINKRFDITTQQGLNMANLNSGYYIIEVRSENSNERFKVLKR